MTTNSTHMNKLLVIMSATFIACFNLNQSFAQKKGGSNCTVASLPSRIITLPFMQRDTLCKTTVPTIDQVNDYHGGNTTLPSEMSATHMTGRDYVYRFTAAQTGPVQIRISYQLSARYFSLLLFEAAGTSLGQCIGYTYESSTAGIGTYPNGIALVSNVKAGVDYYILVDSWGWYAGTNYLRSQYIINADYIPLQTECLNLGFENGNFTNWIGTSGKALTCKNTLASHLNYTPVDVGTSTAQHSIAGSGTDYYGGFSKTYAGSYSAKLGDDTARECGGSQLIQSFMVTPATNYYIYHYAVVFENGPSHPHDTSNSMVKLTTLDENGDTIPGAQYLGIISASSPGFIQVGATDVYYRPWVTQMVDLTSQVGKIVTLIFTVTDCNAGEHFGYAYFDSECSTVPMPVELTHFNAIPNNNTIDLYWRTASEINSDYYIIERSSNNIDFSYVGKTMAAGNSNDEMTYTLTDVDPILGISYYRLTQFDRDGSSTVYSPITVALNSINNASIFAYPNPAYDNTLYVKINSDELMNCSVIEIRTVDGNLMASELVQSSTTEFDIASLPSGAYIMQVISNAKIIKEVLLIRHTR